MAKKETLEVNEIEQVEQVEEVITEVVVDDSMFESVDTETSEKIDQAAKSLFDEQKYKAYVSSPNNFKEDDYVGGYFPKSAEQVGKNGISTIHRVIQELGKELKYGVRQDYDDILNHFHAVFPQHLGFKLFVNHENFKPQGIPLTVLIPARLSGLSRDELEVFCGHKVTILVPQLRIEQIDTLLKSKYEGIKKHVKNFNH